MRPWLVVPLSSVARFARRTVMRNRNRHDVASGAA